MLILSRRIGEKIIIGDGVEVTVIEIKGNQIRLGVTAPQNVPIHRQEVFDRIKNGQGHKKGAEEEKAEE